MGKSASAVDVVSMPKYQRRSESAPDIVRDHHAMLPSVVRKQLKDDFRREGHRLRYNGLFYELRMSKKVDRGKAAARLHRTPLQASVVASQAQPELHPAQRKQGERVQEQRRERLVG